MIFFPWIIFSQTPENNVRIISNFYENSRRYSQVKVHHRYQQHLWEICYWCQLHQWQSVTRAVNFPTSTAGVVDTGGQFAEVGSPQIANLQICWITKFVSFADLRQVWQLADLRFANPIFLRFADPNFFADLKPPQIRKFFTFLLTNTYLKC